MDLQSLKLEVQTIIDELVTSDAHKNESILGHIQVDYPKDCKNNQTKIECEYDRIIELSKSLPVQGTKEWKEYRTDGVGGSEMKIIKNGKDSFGKTIIDLYKRKIGIAEELDDTIVLLQGHIFEDITKYYLKCKYNIDIANVNGPIKSRHNDIGYSMDGLAKMNYKDIQRLDIYKDCSTGIPLRDCLILFEFKSAYTRQLNKVPDYADQVYTGLFTFPLVDLCIFTDTCYKMCTIEQFYEERAYARQLYDMYNSFHKVVHAPIAYSIAFFIGNSDDDAYGELTQLSQEVVTYVFGKFRREECTMENGRVFVYDGVDNNNKSGYISYMRAYIADIYANIEKSGRKVIGYLPWKLYKINFVLYDANDNEITPYLPRIEQFMSLVRTYRNATHEEKMASVGLANFI